MIYIVLEIDRYQDKSAKRLDTVYDNDGEYELAKDKKEAMTALLANVFVNNGDITQEEVEEFIQEFPFDFKASAKDNTYSFFGDEVDYLIVGAT